VRWPTSRRVLFGDNDRLVGFESTHDDERGDGREQASREDDARFDGDLTKNVDHLNNVRTKSTSHVGKRSHQPCFTYSHQRPLSSQMIKRFNDFCRAMLC